MKRKRENDNKGNELKKRKIILTDYENERFEEFWESKKDNIFQQLGRSFVTDELKKGIKEISKKKWYNNVRNTNSDKVKILEKKFENILDKIHAPKPENIKNKEDFIMYMIERMDCITKCHTICYDFIKIIYEVGLEIKNYEDRKDLEGLSKNLDIAMKGNNENYDLFKEYLIKVIEKL